MCPDHKFTNIQVTIFGESAGGYSVKQLLAHPPSPMPYRAAIMQSEATVTGVNGWPALVANLSCADATSPLTCMRAINASDITYAIEHLEITFSPVVDGITNSQDVAPLIKSGQFAQVPFVTGTDSQEGRVFEVGQNNLTAFLESEFPTLTALQTAIKAEYPPSVNMTDYEIISDVFTDIAFQCPTLTLSSLAASRGTNYTNTWRYYYNATFPNIQPYPDLGVFHSSEIPVVFGTYDASTATATEVALSKHVQTAWANFAKYPMNGPGWPRVGYCAGNASEGVVGDIGGNGRKNIRTVTSAQIDGHCAVLQDLVDYLGI